MRPILKPVYVLIHSPLVGPSTWSLVADELRQRGLIAILPALHDSPDIKQPYWQQHAASIAQALAEVPKSVRLILIAHSGAGSLLPAIRLFIPNPVYAYVFVDAGIPRDGATRLDLMKLQDAGWGSDFELQLVHGDRFPTWSMDDLQEVIPDTELRSQMVAELHSRGLDFFSEPLPIFDGWPDAPCIYIQFSESYIWDAAQARQFGWPTYKVEAGHFHMLVEPKTVTQLILDAVHNLP